MSLLAGSVAALAPRAVLAVVDRPLATGGLALGAGLLHLGRNARGRKPVPGDALATTAVRSVVEAPFRRLDATGEGAPAHPSTRR